MANDYDKARAMRSKNGWSYEPEQKTKKISKRKVKSFFKNPILIIAVVAVILGAIGGFFAIKLTSAFEFNDYFVNGVAAAEKDYVVVDVSEHKALRFSSDILAGTVVESQDIYETLDLLDKGVSIKFLGKDVSDSITVKYYYREDISHDAVEVGKVDVSIPGVYYVEYTSSHFAYKNTTLIRTIVVTGVEVDG